MSLFDAARSGDAKLIQSLVENGADVHKTNYYGYTALHFAAFSGHANVCEALVKEGSRINLRDKQGATPVFVAASRGHSKVVELLIQLGASRHRTNQTGQTPLHVAAHKGHLETVEALVQLGADVHRTDDLGNTPLHLAADLAEPSMMDMFVNAGSNVRSSRDDGATPLHMVAQNGHAAQAKALVGQGANPDDATADGKTAINIAASKGHSGVISVLAAMGASIDKPDERFGFTPLHDAARHGHLDVVKTLLSLGANSSAQDNFGDTALDLARTSGHPEALDLLKAVGELQATVKAGKVSEIRAAVLANPTRVALVQWWPLMLPHVKEVLEEELEQVYAGTDQQWQWNYLTKKRPPPRASRTGGGRAATSPDAVFSSDGAAAASSDGAAKALRASHSPPKTKTSTTAASSSSSSSSSVGSDLCGNLDDDQAANESHCGGEVRPAVLHLGLLQMLSIVTFAYTAHVQLLTVANEVEDYTQAKMDKIIVCGVLICGGAYLVVGLGGYLAFGDEVAGNVLLSYPTKNASVACARVAVSGLVGISYPLMCKPGRDSFLSLLRNSEAWKASADSTAAYVGFTLGFLGCSYGVAMGLVNNPNALDLILSLLGATTSTVIAYIVPTVVYATTHPEPHWKRTFAIGVGIFGVVSMPFAIAASFTS